VNLSQPVKVDVHIFSKLKHDFWKIKFQKLHKHRILKSTIVDSASNTRKVKLDEYARIKSIFLSLSILQRSQNISSKPNKTTRGTTKMS
jgi:hypothetical protein